MERLDKVKRLETARIRTIKCGVGGGTKWSGIAAVDGKLVY